MQPTFVDFEVYPPHDHGVVLDAAPGTGFSGEHHLIRPGGQVVLGGFSVTAQAGADLVVTVRGHAEATARDVPVRLRVNGEDLAVLPAVPGLGDPVESRFTIPSALLTPGARDELSLSVAPGADGAFCLFHVLVDAADRPGESEKVRRQIADEGSLSVYRTRSGAPGAEDVEGVLWLRVRGIGRAGLATLAWRLRDGDRATVAFDGRQTAFTGRRVTGPDGEPVSFVGRAGGIRGLTRLTPRPSRTVVFDAQLQDEDGWRDAGPLTVHLDFDDGDCPLADLDWTDGNGARTAISLTPDGRAFFGHYQRSGGEALAYRGRVRGAARPFPFEPAPEENFSPPQEVEFEVFDTCPAAGSSLDSAGAAVPADAALATALRHQLIAHGFSGRPALARKIRELTPHEAPLAVAQLARCLADPAADPSARSGMYLEQPPDDYERLCTALALAVLDVSYTDTAAQAYRAASPFPAALFGADYGSLGSSAAEEARVRLRHIAASTRQEQVAVEAVRSLVRLGFTGDVVAAVRGCAERGVHLPRVVRPLAEVHPEVLPALVDSELAALAASPDRFLAFRPRSGEGVNSLGDIVVEVSSCGSDYRPAVATTLWQLVRSTDHGAGVRWRAACELAVVDPAEKDRALAYLRAEGVEDPHAPRPPQPPRTAAELESARTVVAALWQRIEEQLAARFPAFPVTLGGPATVEEVAACEQALGLQLPTDFAASCLVHRSIAFAGLVTGMPQQLDLADLPASRDAQEIGAWTSDRPEQPGAAIREDHGPRAGWVPLEPDDGGDIAALDLDPAPGGRYGQVIGLDRGSPAGVEAGSWLELLERFAANLEADRYVLHRDGYLELR